MEYNDFILSTIYGESPIVAGFLQDEIKRQEDNIELIASENFVSDAVLAAAGSCFTNKYAEGYPSNRYSGREGRYYGGTQNVDKLEEYCCDKWREVFKTNYHVNVQPHSGSQANLAAYKEASGVRIGTPAMTTKGYVEEDFIRVADEIDRLIKEYIKKKEAN